MEPTLDRSALRGILRAARRAIDPDYAHQAATRVATSLEALPEWRTARLIAAYHAVRGELDPSLALGRVAERGAVVTYPVLTHDESLAFARPGYSAPRPNRFAIPEPTGARVALEELNLVLVPLVGFDRRGNRLGSGAGYYDRTFAGHQRGAQPLLIGLAYGCQHVAALEAASWDVPLDLVITELEVIDCRGPGDR
jgi:5-formyltetrahydrofolate cyclo-ligase